MCVLPLCAVHFCVSVSARLRLHPDVPIQRGRQRLGRHVAEFTPHERWGERERAGLTRRTTWHIWRRLCYQPLPLICLLMWQGKSRLPAHGCRTVDCMLDIPTLPKLRGVWASRALKMWKMWVSLIPNNHQAQTETLWILDPDCALRYIWKAIACFFLRCSYWDTECFKFNERVSRVRGMATFTSSLPIKHNKESLSLPAGLFETTW